MACWWYGKESSGQSKEEPTDVSLLAHFLGAQSTTETTMLKAVEPTGSEISRVMSAFSWSRGGSQGYNKPLRQFVAVDPE
jgi:hypothetical protein